jgi:hypothetical protein
VTLRDALATALAENVPGLPYVKAHRRSPTLMADISALVLSDPAFRLALTESIAEALEGLDWSAHTRTTEVTTDADLPIRVYESEVDVDSFAAAIVARMLGG